MTKVPDIEKELVRAKEWKHKGEIKASERPVNSLLNADIEFETKIINVPVSKTENNETFKYIVQRFREKTFDNHEFVFAEPAPEQQNIETIETDRELMDLYRKIEAEIKGMMDYGNTV